MPVARGSGLMRLSVKAFGYLPLRLMLPSTDLFKITSEATLQSGAGLDSTYWSITVTTVSWCQGAIQLSQPWLQFFRICFASMWNKQVSSNTKPNKWWSWMIDPHKVLSKHERSKVWLLPAYRKSQPFNPFQTCETPSLPISGQASVSLLDSENCTPES